MFALNFHLIFMGAKKISDGCCLDTTKDPANFGIQIGTMRRTKKVTWAKKPIEVTKCDRQSEEDKQMKNPEKSAIVAGW